MKKFNDQEKNYYYDRVKNLYNEIIANAPEQNREAAKAIVNKMFEDIFNSEDFASQCQWLLHCDKRGLVQSLIPYYKK